MPIDTYLIPILLDICLRAYKTPLNESPESEFVHFLY